MFQVILPNNILFVAPEQLPRLLANLAETKYVAVSGEFLQTTTEHNLVTDSTIATLLIKQPIQAIRDEREQFRDLWQNAKRSLERLEGKMEKSKMKAATKGKKRS